MTKVLKTTHPVKMDHLQCEGCIPQTFLLYFQVLVFENEKANLLFAYFLVLILCTVTHELLRAAWAQLTALHPRAAHTWAVHLGLDTVSASAHHRRAKQTHAWAEVDFGLLPAKGLLPIYTNGELREKSKGWKQ